MKHKSEKPKAVTREAPTPEMENFIPDEEKRKSERPQPRSLDPLSQALKCSHYYRNMRWDWFRFDFGGIKHPMEVARFYPQIKLAIDFDFHKDKQVQEHKQELFKEQKIKYYVLKDMSNMTKMVEEVLTEHVV